MPAPGAAPATDTSSRPDAQIGELQGKVAALEAAVAEAQREARRNLLKGTLVLEFDGRTPDEILKPILEVEPERGTVRFGSNPDLFASMAWTYLYKIVDEDFEEALQRCLDRDLQWTKACDLGPEEVQMVRDYTERAYQLMVAIQRRAATMRRLLADPGALTPEEGERLRKLPWIDDHRVYVRSYEPSFRIRLLFPKKEGK